MPFGHPGQELVDGDTVEGSGFSVMDAIVADRSTVGVPSRIESQGA